MYENCYQIQKLTWRDRLFSELPFPTFPDEGFVIRTESTTFLGWKDRLKILLSGKCTTKTQLITEGPVKVLRSEAVFSVVK
jgi:hypothetical protein